MVLSSFSPELELQECIAVRMFTISYQYVLLVVLIVLHDQYLPSHPLSLNSLLLLPG